jgi:lysophospholipase L1-like esterase
MIRHVAAVLTALLGGTPMTLAAAETPVAPVVAVVGDSYAAGFGAGPSPRQDQAWFQYTARDLGWQVGSVVANPGAGYLKRGDYGTLTQSLRDHPIPAWTDYVLVQSGLNDAAQDPAQIPAAVAELLAVVREQAPHAVPVVIGMFMPSVDRLVSPRQLAVARQIGDWRAIGDTRYAIAYMCSFEVSRDGTHPTAAGHQQIGDWVAWHVAHGLDNGTPLHWNGTAYTV